MKTKSGIFLTAMIFTGALMLLPVASHADEISSAGQAPGSIASVDYSMDYVQEMADQNPAANYSSSYTGPAGGIALGYREGCTYYAAIDGTNLNIIQINAAYSPGGAKQFTGGTCNTFSEPLSSFNFQNPYGDNFYKSDVLHPNSILAGCLGGAGKIELMLWDNSNQSNPPLFVNLTLNNSGGYAISDIPVNPIGTGSFPLDASALSNSKVHSASQNFQGCYLSISMCYAGAGNYLISVPTSNGITIYTYNRGNFEFSPLNGLNFQYFQDNYQNLCTSISNSAGANEYYLGTLSLVSWSIHKNDIYLTSNLMNSTVFSEPIKISTLAPVIYASVYEGIDGVYVATSETDAVEELFYVPYTDRTNSDYSLNSLNVTSQTIYNGPADTDPNGGPTYGGGAVQPVIWGVLQDSDGEIKNTSAPGSIGFNVCISTPIIAQDNGTFNNYEYFLYRVCNAVHYSELHLTENNDFSINSVTSMDGYFITLGYVFDLNPNSAENSPEWGISSIGYEEGSGISVHASNTNCIGLGGISYESSTLQSNTSTASTTSSFALPDEKHMGEGESNTLGVYTQFNLVHFLLGNRQYWAECNTINKKQILPGIVVNGQRWNTSQIEGFEQTLVNLENSNAAYRIPTTGEEGALDLKTDYENSNEFKISLTADASILDLMPVSASTETMSGYTTIQSKGFNIDLEDAKGSASTSTIDYFPTKALQGTSLSGAFVIANMG